MRHIAPAIRKPYLYRSSKTDTDTPHLKREGKAEQAAALAALEKQAAEAASAKEELSLVEEAKIEEKIGVADAMKGENAEVLQLSGIYLSVEQVEESMT